MLFVLLAPRNPKPSTPVRPRWTPREPETRRRRKKPAAAKG